MQTVDRKKNPKTMMVRGASRLSVLASDESGVVAVIVALVIVVLLSVVALVVDLGALYDHDRELQTAADAGALAGVQELIRRGDSENIEDLARQEADAYVQANLAQSSPNAENTRYVDPSDPQHSAQIEGPVVSDDKRSVTVDVREINIPFTFAKVFTSDNGTAFAHAKAVAAYLTGVPNLLPAPVLYMHPDSFVLKYKHTGNGTEITVPLNYQGIGDQHDDHEDIYRGATTLARASLPSGTYKVRLYEEFDGKLSPAVDRSPNDPDDDGLVGSMYVPPATPGAKNNIVWVNVYRDISLVSKTDPDPQHQNREAVTIEVFTRPDFNGKVQAQLTGLKGWQDLTASRTGVYMGTFSVPAPNFGTDGMGDVQVQVKAGNDTAETEYTWFQAAHPLRYVNWQANWAGESAGSVTFAATVCARALRFYEERILKFILTSQGGNTGNDFWANIWGPKEGQYGLAWEVEAALGGAAAGEIPKLLAEDTPNDPEPNPDWGLNPETNDNDLIDIGESIPSYQGNTGTNELRHLVDLLDDAKVVFLPLVGPEAKSGSTEFVVRGFGAFEVSRVGFQESPSQIWIAGRFIREVYSGKWQLDPPNGTVYLETPVLRE
ncbi:MAG: Tad domain-containing protein [Thermoleophilia bacterium]|nr:Tad domain-containing protein [Thermoleophilia bacterium]